MSNNRHCFAKWLPRELCILVFAFLLLSLTVSIVNPLFEPPDEIRHYRYIRKLVVDRQLPIQGQETVRSQSHHPPLYHALSALLSFWIPTSHTSTYEHPANPFWGYRNWAVGVDNKLQYLHSSAEQLPFRGGFFAAMVPRWLNVLIGAAVVVLTYYLGVHLWPDLRGLALGGAAIVAFNPQFIYMSAAMNNDIGAALFGTAVLLMCVVIVRDGANRQRLICLGGAYGLALLTKIHLAVMGGVIAVALVFETGAAQGRGARIRRCFHNLMIVGAVSVIIAGWWFVRNWLLYGDPTGINELNALWAGRPAGGNWWAIQQGIPYLWASLWGRFGYGQIPLPQVMYQGILILCLFSLLGYARIKGRVYRPHLFILLILTLIFTLGIVFYYMLIQPAGAMGRFLFPALPAFALLLVGGLNGWLRVPSRTSRVALFIILTLAVVALSFYLWPALRYPLSVDPETLSHPLDVQFGDVARVLDVEVRPEKVQPGESIWVSVVWQPLRTTARPYIVYVHLIDEVGALIAQRDTWPGLGRAPTTQWRRAYTFMDTYRVDLEPSVYAPNRVSIQVGLYEPEWGRLPLSVDGAMPAEEQGLEVGQVDILPVPGPRPNTQSVNFSDEIALVGYILEPRIVYAGETLTATLYWKVLSQPQYDYMVFAQVLGTDFRVWGSQDGGSMTWPPIGGIITETRQITLLPEAPAGSYPLQVGLFHSEIGRLPVVAEDGRHLDERAVLGPIRVLPLRLP